MSRERFADKLEAVVGYLRLAVVSNPSINRKSVAHERSDHINEIAAALAKAQGEMRPANAAMEADLTGVWWDVCRAALSKNGIAIVQAPRSTEGGIEVETLLCHSSGQWMRKALALPVSTDDAQGIGSAITFARRYALASFAGLAPELHANNGQEQSEQEDRQTEKVPADDCPIVLGPTWQDKPLVLGKAKKVPTPGAYKVLKALVQSYHTDEGGLTKDELESVNTAGRRILRDVLMADPDWAAVLEMAGEKGGLYRIRRLSTLSHHSAHDK